MQNEDQSIPPPVPPEASTQPVPESAPAPLAKSAQTRALPPPVSRAAAKPKRPVWSVLSGLCLLAGLAAVGFYTWEQHQAIEVLFGQYNQLLQERSGVEAQLATLETSRQQWTQTVQEQLQASQAAVAAQGEQVTALNRELINTRLRINDSGAGASQAWMLTEAESLLRFAQQRLLLAHDVRAALGLFVASDDLLKQMNDPAVFSVREALALDLGALQAVREVDVPGIYARLGALITGLDELRVQPAGERPAFRVEAPVPETQDAGATWWGSLKTSLGQYFVITREANDAVPQLSAEQTWVLRETLRLKLEQARLALVQSRPELYQAALVEASTGIEALMQGASKASLLAELNTLRDLPIVTVVPSVNLGLTALRQLQPGSLSSFEASP